MPKIGDTNDLNWLGRNLPSGYLHLEFDLREKSQANSTIVGVFGRNLYTFAGTSALEMRCVESWTPANSRELYLAMNNDNLLLRFTDVAFLAEKREYSNVRVQGNLPILQRHPWNDLILSLIVGDQPQFGISVLQAKQHLVCIPEMVIPPRQYWYWQLEPYFYRALPEPAVYVFAVGFKTSIYREHKYPSEEE